jgi:isopenicillin-N epimerase
VTTDRRGLLRRRDFLVRSGLVLGASSVTGAAGFVAAKAVAGDEERTPVPSQAPALRTWNDVRALFDLTSELTDLTTFMLAPHPRPVREAIARHRRGLDSSPKEYLFAHELEEEQRVTAAAAEYLGASLEDIAFTDSTTMGLGLFYGGFRLRPGQEILTTEHDFYATHESLRLRVLRTGSTLTRVRLFRDARTVSADEIVDSLHRWVTPRVRLVAVTWVHSSTGLKMPVRAIADALADVNARRDERDRVLLAVDGVHGFGVEDVAVADLGCDIFISGGHKWLFGPRGTGVVWARPEAWSETTATIPTFDGNSYRAWLEEREPVDLPPGPRMTPGGFHSFEHRWALADAFELHGRIGRRRIAERTHGFAGRLKEGLAEIPGVRVITPAADDLSAGIVCFEIEAMPAREAVDALRARHRIVASVTPYAAEYVRLGPSIANGPEDVDAALPAVRALAWAPTTSRSWPARERRRGWRAPRPRAARRSSPASGPARSPRPPRHPGSRSTRR